jgi:serine phosphatase RsbU (regulator of sigma subunit)
MEVQIAVSKVKKYATSTSGDTVEVIERPKGGLSIVLADGQSSGRGAKWVSSFVVRKVLSLLADGVRDGAAARAASDALFTERQGKVSATLNILSVDMQTKTLVITRNNPAPVVLARDDEITVLDEDSKQIGFYVNTRPLITQVPLEAGLTVVAFTDGITHAGSRSGDSMDVCTCLQSLLDDGNPTPQEIADSLLEHALKLDQNRPVDDTSVVTLRVMTPDEASLIRRMTVSLPIRP